MTAEATEPNALRRRAWLLPVLLTPILALAGFLVTYLGLVPLGLPGSAQHSDPARQIAFVDLPPVVTTVTSEFPRQVLIAAKLEVPAEKRAAVEHMLPRVSDAVTSFVAGIDAKAFDKRGILEIIRAELLTRANYVLGEGAVNDLLITEFSVQ